jgi:hypothetical protein
MCQVVYYKRRSIQKVIYELTKVSTGCLIAVIPTWTANRLVHTKVEEKVSILRKLKLYIQMSAYVAGESTTQACEHMFLCFS